MHWSYNFLPLTHQNVAYIPNFELTTDTPHLKFLAEGWDTIVNILEKNDPAITD